MMQQSSCPDVYASPARWCHHSPHAAAAQPLLFPRRSPGQVAAPVAAYDSWPAFSAGHGFAQIGTSILHIEPASGNRMVLYTAGEKPQGDFRRLVYGQNPPDAELVIDHRRIVKDKMFRFARPPRCCR